MLGEISGNWVGDTLTGFLTLWKDSKGKGWGDKLHVSQFEIFKK